MPDDLYDRDILSWSEHQADLPRRLGRGEGVNGIDWAHVVDEIEDVGLSELHSVQSYLNLMLVHLMKIRLSPNSQALGHCRTEIVAFQNDAGRRFAPSMRQRIDLQALYEEATEQMEAGGLLSDTPGQLPAHCPFTLDQLLPDKWNALEHSWSRRTRAERAKPVHPRRSRALWRRSPHGRGCVWCSFRLPCRTVPATRAASD